jgi:hypothetical protein
MTTGTIRESPCAPSSKCTMGHTEGNAELPSSQGKRVTQSVTLLRMPAREGTPVLRRWTDGPLRSGRNFQRGFYITIGGRSLFASHFSSGQ